MPLNSEADPRAFSKCDDVVIECGNRIVPEAVFVEIKENVLYTGSKMFGIRYQTPRWRRHGGVFDDRNPSACRCASPRSLGGSRVSSRGRRGDGSLSPSFHWSDPTIDLDRGGILRSPNQNRNIPLIDGRGRCHQ